MATISAPGIGSGLDVKSIVTQLMDLERRPLVALQARAAEYDTQISAYGQLKSALATFQSAMRGLDDLSAFSKYSATSGNTNILTASADSSATAGKHTIEVQRLAQAHKLATSSQNKDTVFGGTAGDGMTINIDTFSFSVDMSSGMTLAQLKSAINNAPGNPGVRAELVNVDSSGTNQRLALMSPATGQAHRIELTGSGTFDPGTSLGFATTNQVGGVPVADLSLLDSSLVVDGIPLTREENLVEDAVTGVALNLQSAAPGTTVTLDVARDMETTKKSVQAFADAYNALMETAKSLREGDLSSDSSIRTLESQIRGVLNSGAAAGTFTHLSQVGLSLDKTGTMQFSSDRLTKALAEDPASVADVFAKSGTGYAYKFDKMVDGLLGFKGLVQNRISGLEQRKRDNSEDQLNMEDRLAMVEERFNRQYTALDSIVSQMTSTSNFLSQQLSSLNSSKK